MPARVADLAIPNPAVLSPDLDPVNRFTAGVVALAAEHRPSRMPFFERLAALPREAARNPELLEQIYLVYQSAMKCFDQHVESGMPRKHSK